MSTKNYNSSKFNGLRDKERKVNYRDKSIRPAPSAKPTRTIKNMKNFPINVGGIKIPPGFEIDLDKIDKTIKKIMTGYRGTPFEPIPVMGFVGDTIKCKCGASEWKKVFYTNSEAYKMCLGCKADLGDV